MEFILNSDQERASITGLDADVAWVALVVILAADP